MGNENYIAFLIYTFTYMQINYKARYTYEIMGWSFHKRRKSISSQL